MGLEDIEKATNDLLQVSSLPPVFLILRSAPPSPSFPLTHPLMVIYLVGKGSAFSPERSTTGREQRQRWKKERGGERRTKKYISHVGLPGDTDSASYSPSQL